MFASELEDAGRAGFKVTDRPKISGSHAALLKKSE
jgi:hypothetical protein